MREEDRESGFDAQVREAYRAPGDADASAAARTLESLARLSPPRRRWSDAWFAPRFVALSPVGAAALLLVVLAAGVLVGTRVTPRAPAAPREGAAARLAATARGAPVTFVLRAPGASRVSVVGDFNGWDATATPLARAGSGDLWLVRLPLSEGVHEYSFVLNGEEWRPDPSAPLASEAGFGRPNSVVVVGEGTSL